MKKGYRLNELNIIPGYYSSFFKSLNTAVDCRYWRLTVPKELFLNHFGVFSV